MNTCFASAATFTMGAPLVEPTASHAAFMGDPLALGLLVLPLGVLAAGVVKRWLRAGQRRAATPADLTADAVQRISDSLAQTAGLLQERVAEHTTEEQAQRDRGQALLTRLEQVAAAFERRQDADAQSLQRFLDATADRMQQGEARAQERLDAFVEGISERMQQAEARAQERFDAFVEGTSGRMRQAEVQSQERFDAFVDATAERMQQGEARAQERFDAFVEAMHKTAQGQAERLSEYASNLQQRQAEAQAAVAAEVEQAIGRMAEQGEQLTAHHAQAANSLTEQVGQAVAAMGERLGTVGQDLMRAETALLERHKALSEQADVHARAQAAQLAEVQSALIAQHSKRTEALCDLMDKRLGGLQERLDKGAALLAEAADLVRSGGAELVTVAETFGAAVEQQRQAADRWLENLGDVERRIADAGEDAAVGALDQHLARTHELFERQLNFQQELIQQLHAGPGSSDAQERTADASP